MELHQPSDVPPAKRRLSHFLSIILPLLLINVGVGHILWKQIAPHAGAEVAQVKDETTTYPSVEEVTTDNSKEVAIDDTSDVPPIATYVVKSGDTLSGIAEKFHISVNTIRWANDLTEKTSKITVGDELVILPVSGLEYTVKKGDTLSGIAVKFDASQDDILKYNDIEADAIKVGMSLIIPGAEPIKAPTPAKKSVTKPSPSTKEDTIKPSTQKPTQEDSEPKQTSTTYATPVHGVLTQGIHDGNAVDFGVSTGTSVHAFKSGTVIVAKSSGYNGGYGNYIVINHEGSCQTQYSHLSKVSVSVGDTVDAGDTIALSGNTGRSTGPHLHFNARNCGGNPFAKYKIGTQF